jgi:hypothetical protein
MNAFRIGDTNSCSFTASRLASSLVINLTKLCTKLIDLNFHMISSNHFRNQGDEGIIQASEAHEFPAPYS